MGQEERYGAMIWSDCGHDYGDLVWELSPVETDYCGV